MRDTFMLNFECIVQEGRRKDELDAALARYNEMFVPGSKKILALVDRDYVKRLEAAYLDAYLYVIEARKCHYPGFGVDDVWRKEARESLERIKRGDPK